MFSCLVNISSSNCEWGMCPVRPVQPQVLPVCCRFTASQVVWLHLNQQVHHPGLFGSHALGNASGEILLWPWYPACVYLLLFIFRCRWWEGCVGRRGEQADGDRGRNPLHSSRHRGRHRRWVPSSIICRHLYLEADGVWRFPLSRWCECGESDRADPEGERRPSERAGEKRASFSNSVLALYSIYGKTRPYFTTMSHTDVAL